MRVNATEQVVETGVDLVEMSLCKLQISFLDQNCLQMAILTD
jgi:hypothetical protein